MSIVSRPRFWKTVAELDYRGSWVTCSDCRPRSSGLAAPVVENVLLQPPLRITWRLAIEREEAALGRHDDFISRSFSGLKELFERRP